MILMHKFLQPSILFCEIRHDKLIRHNKDACDVDPAIKALQSNCGIKRNTWADGTTYQPPMSNIRKLCCRVGPMLKKGEREGGEEEKED